MKEGRSKEYLKGTRRRYGSQLPLERVLRSRVGKQWDKIHAEFCEEFDKRTIAGREFFKSLSWEVETNCWKGAQSGTIYDEKGQEVFGFYVHPLSGCLEYKSAPKYERPEAPVIRIPIGEDKYYEKIEGIWYYTHMSKHTYYSAWASETPYIIEKRQLTKKQLKKLNLVNDPPEKRREDKLKAQEELKKIKANGIQS